MRKVLISLPALVLICQVVSGGINTNTNQSASWVRMLVRDASTEIDAVYFNPAGLTKLPDGFHISLNNQFITKGRTIGNDYAHLNNSTFEGTASAYLFPDIYAAYKRGKFVVSAGFSPIGGGGNAEYEKGLPSFELPPSDLREVPGGVVTGYSLSTSLEGSSSFLGIQLGVSYAINDIISVCLGGRYIITKNTYAGYMQDIMVSTAAGDMTAVAFMEQLEVQMTSLAGVAGNLQLLIDGGLGSYDLTTVQGIGFLTQEEVDGIVAGWALINPAVDPMTLDLNTLHYWYDLATPSFIEGADEAAARQILLADQEVDAEQNGTGITPIISVNISPMDNLNLAIRYEFATKIELENSTPAGKGGLIDLTPTGDPVYMFPDGGKTRADLPAMLTLGIGYGITSDLNVMAGFNYFFDKSADYGRTINRLPVKNDEVIDNNGWEVSFGVEYALNESFTFSAGYHRNQSGVMGKYQKDMSFDLSSNTIGGGLKYTINDMLRINFGVAYAKFVDGDKTYSHFPGGDLTATPVVVKETYKEDALVFGLGLDLSF